MVLTNSPSRVSHTENATAIVPQNLTTGQYRISADVMLAGNRTFNGTGLINVFKAGTLNKTGQLLTLSIGNSVFFNTGDIVKITGTFRNTGELPVSAKLVCEVTADSTTGKLAGVVDGDPLQVTPNQTLDLTAYYTARDAGRFVINGHALFGDKVSESKSTMINVSASGLDVLPIALAVLVVIGAVGSYYYYRHYRRRKGA
jgi:hypothetical protein